MSQSFQSTSIDSLFQKEESPYLQDLRVIGCLALELFLPQKFRALSDDVDFQRKLGFCRKLLQSEIAAPSSSLPTNVRNFVRSFLCSQLDMSCQIYISVQVLLNFPLKLFQSLPPRPPSSGLRLWTPATHGHAPPFKLDIATRVPFFIRGAVRNSAVFSSNGDHGLPNFGGGRAGTSHS